MPAAPAKPIRVSGFSYDSNRMLIRFEPSSNTSLPVDPSTDTLTGVLILISCLSLPEIPEFGVFQNCITLNFVFAKIEYAFDCWFEHDYE